jgi:hypothetical protein
VVTFRVVVMSSSRLVLLRCRHRVVSRGLVVSFSGYVLCCRGVVSWRRLVVLLCRQAVTFCVVEALSRLVLLYCRGVVLFLVFLSSDYVSSPRKRVPNYYT